MREVIKNRTYEVRIECALQLAPNRLGTFFRPSKYPYMETIQGVCSACQQVVNERVANGEQIGKTSH